MLKNNTIWVKCAGFACYFWLNFAFEINKLALLRSYKFKGFDATSLELYKCVSIVYRYNKTWCSSNSVYMKRTSFTSAAPQPKKLLTGRDGLSQIRSILHALYYLVRELYWYSKWNRPFHALNPRYHEKRYFLLHLSIQWRCNMNHEAWLLVHSSNC